MFVEHVYPFHQSFGIFVVKPQSINDLPESLFHFLPVHLILLNSAHPSSLLVFSLFVKLLFLFWLQWLSPPAQRDIVLFDRAWIFNKRWVTVSDTLSKLVGGKGSDYRLWSHACETKPQPLSTHFLSTFAIVLALESTDLRVLVNCLCSEGIFHWHTYHWTETYVANLTIRNMYEIRQMQSNK